MERNDASGNPGLTNGQSDSTEFSGSESAKPSNDFDFSGSTGSTEPGLRDRAKNAVGGAGEKLSAAGSSVRDRAGVVKDRLADALENGAERLRSPGGATFAGATTDGSLSVQGDGRIAQVSDRVAGGMQASADWLRDADIASMKSGIESQVKEHPGRTLLIAAGLGYLIARAFRNDK